MRGGVAAALFNFAFLCAMLRPMNSKTFPHLTFTIQIFHEGKLFVAYNPELDVSSCGSTLEKAKINIKDAIRGFLKSAAKMGTLREILEEAVFIIKNNLRSARISREEYFRLLKV